MKLRIVVDPDLCIGAASCVTVAPESFVLNTDNKAEVLDNGEAPDGPQYERTVEMTEDEKQNLIVAAQSCPTLAITIFDENDVQIYPNV